MFFVRKRVNYIVWVNRHVLVWKINSTSEPSLLWYDRYSRKRQTQCRLQGRLGVRLPWLPAGLLINVKLTWCLSQKRSTINFWRPSSLNRDVIFSCMTASYYSAVRTTLASYLMTCWSDSTTTNRFGYLEHSVCIHFYCINFSYTTRQTHL